MKKIVLSLFVASSFFQSCSNDDDAVNPDLTSGLEVSDFIDVTNFSRDNTGTYINNYSTLFVRDNSSTVSFGGQTTRLKQAVEIGGNLKSSSVSSNDIQVKFEGIDGTSTGFDDASLNETTKILRSKTSASIGLFGSNKNESGQGKMNVEAVDAFIVGHDAVVADWSTPAAAGQAGTFLDADGSTRYVDAKGFELDQLFTKSLMGALAYDQAVNHYLNRLDNENGDDANGTKDYRKFNDEGKIAEGKDYTTMEHHWDEAFGYVYGNITKENLLYKYLDNVDGLAKFSGTEKDIFEAFVKGRIAIVDKDYTTRDAQIAILREKLGLVIAVRAVHYLGGGAKILDDQTKNTEDAFHDLCEGYGFVNSLRYVVNANGSKYFTDAEVDAFIATLNAGSGLWDVTSTELRNMADDIAAKGVGGLSWTFEDVVN
ncbi:DUF4856 domain-containing protein [Hyunsoonleella pacifica]|uniref:DUF4856 domain-containing protein n=1 Tax=Hyunsoonleella pacifica TaxID=1080224 RepID=A0A4V2JBB2_9FLAO|nr:DUF4856 domain-containing protein [Hyunsoonleella pacifica]TBN18571.1 DUF4856 domain-containing protein [Hyunsoonleella pacifica]GGD02911.1 DUF4856 domain-containing protein [Hyunsoonleella pacifica]